MCFGSLFCHGGVDPRVPVGGPHHPSRRLHVVGDGDDGDDPRPPPRDPRWRACRRRPLRRRHRDGCARNDQCGQRFRGWRGPDGRTSDGTARGQRCGRSTWPPRKGSTHRLLDQSRRWSLAHIRRYRRVSIPKLCLRQFDGVAGLHSGTVQRGVAVVDGDRRRRPVLRYALEAIRANPLPRRSSATSSSTPADARSRDTKSPKCLSEHRRSHAHPPEKPTTDGPAAALAAAHNSATTATTGPRSDHSIISRETIGG
jgi:hypothetical protein